MKKVLVTGGAGYIGSVLVKNLLSNGYSVRVLDRFIFGGESLLSFATDKNLEIIEGDVRDTSIVNKALEGIDMVVHLAALVGENACAQNPTVTVEINQEAVACLVSKAKEKNIERFVFISTCSNYGISTEAEATEESELNPLSLYAETKIASEKNVLSQASPEFCVTVLRLATIFGLSPKMRFNLMVNELARETALDGKFEIRNRNASRPFLHVDDASSAIISILESPEDKVAGQIFNVVSENVTKGDLVDIAKKVNPQIDITVSEAGKDDRRDYRVSSAKIQQVLSWQPKVKVEEGFLEIYNAVKERLFKDPYEARYNAWFDDKVFEEKFN